MSSSSDQEDSAVEDLLAQVARLSFRLGQSRQTQPQGQRGLSKKSIDRREPESSSPAVEGVLKGGYDPKVKEEPRDSEQQGTKRYSHPLPKQEKPTRTSVPPKASPKARTSAPAPPPPLFAASGPYRGFEVKGGGYVDHYPRSRTSPGVGYWEQTGSGASTRSASLPKAVPASKAPPVVPTATAASGSELCFRVVYSPGEARGIYFGTAAQLYRHCVVKVFFKNEPSLDRARTYFGWKLPGLPQPDVIYL